VFRVLVGGAVGVNKRNTQATYQLDLFSKQKGEHNIC
jgi:hypothetical protein